MQFWTLDEFNESIEVVSDKSISKMIFNLLFWSVIGSGELLALTGQDFDKENLTVKKNKSCTHLNKKILFQNQKHQNPKELFLCLNLLLII